jgi:YfiR/HmsC-like
VLLAGVLLSAARPGLAEQMPVPASLQVPLILKILTYDRQFETRSGSALSIGIVYSPADADSSKATTAVTDVLNRFAGKTVKNLPVKYWTIEYVSPERLESVLKEKAINVLYVSPGNDRNLAAITRLSRAGQITTATGVPDYVRKGVAVGVGERQGKPQILINLEASKSEGIDFDAGLLRIATVVP